METAKLIVIAGATASGKTSLAIALAQHLQTEIISCDARQFYKELEIGVAKPSAAQLAMVPHHFIGHKSIQENYSIADFEKEALALSASLFKKHQTIILCGGSGLYIDALCNGIDEMPAISEEIKQQVAILNQSERISIIQDKDPEYYAELDIQNIRRVQRACEVILQSGESFSSFRTGHKKNRPFTIYKFAIDIEREALYQQINHRVDAMIEAGLEAEAKTLFPLLPNKNLDTIGYREFFDSFNGLQSREQAIDKIKQHTRNYAKRQMTWFRKDKSIQWVKSENIEVILQAIQN
ncbi:MAG: tRNA (adenosine(37)-N6)-dimethylallyltransferase MiaA [Bacteroidota bacterium]